MVAVPGARAVRVDLTDQSACVIFDPERVPLATLRAALEAMGYTPAAETVHEG